jgi:hypothetical protein
VKKMSIFKRKNKETIPTETLEDKTGIGFLAKIKIDNYLKTNFPNTDDEHKCYSMSDVRKRLKETLNIFVDKKEYGKLDYVLAKGEELLNVDNATGHTFIMRSNYILQNDLESIDYAIEKTKELLSKGWHFNVDKLLDIYLDVKDKAQLDVLIQKGERIFRITQEYNSSKSISSSSIDFYRKLSKDLGEANTEKIITVAENIAKTDIESANKILSYDILDRFADVDKEIVSKFIDIADSINIQSDLVVQSDKLVNPVSEAKAYFFKSCAYTLSAIYKEGKNDANTVIDSVSRIAKKSTHSAMDTLIGINGIIYSERESANIIQTKLLKNTLDILESIVQTPFRQNFVAQIYTGLKTYSKDKLLSNIANAESIAKKIDYSTSEVFDKNLVYCQKYLDSTVKTIYEQVEQQAAISPMVARDLFLAADNLIENTGNGEESFKVMASYVKKLSLKDENLASSLLRHGAYTLRDHGEQGLKDIITAAIILKKYGDDFYTYMMQDTGAVKVR